MAWAPLVAALANIGYSAYAAHKDKRRQEHLSKTNAKLSDSGDLFSGKKDQLLKLQNFTPEQQSLLKEMAKHSYVHIPNITKDPNYQAGTGYLQKIISQDPETMKQFEAPYMRQFNEQIIPALAERFAGLGAQNSSAFQQTMGAAGAGLQEQLAAMKANLGMNAAQHLFGYSQLPGAQRQAENEMTLRQRGMALGASPYDYLYQRGSPGLNAAGGSALPSLVAKFGPEFVDSILNYIKGNSSTPTVSASDVGKVHNVPRIRDTWGYSNL